MLRPTCPVDYRMCNQTVTVYRCKDGQYLRTVYDRAFLDFKKTVSVDKSGSREANSFLLVIPGSAQTVFPKDKVYDGIGPEIADREAWRDFTPTLVSGLVTVEWADAKKWNGQIVHTEAGG